MESEWKTPKFTVGQQIATFLVSYGLLPKVWEESLHASNSEGCTVNEYEDFVCFAFASFQRVEDFIVNQSKCGKDNIQTVQNVFSGCLNPDLIHPGALTLFLHIMEKTDLQAKLQIYTDSKQRKLKPIIFVGHSIGGSIATLATLWVLEKRLRQISPFCITFGCPLVGNERLVEAVGRENWRGNFCHVVSQHDIVPRMLLAPIESIAKPFTTICSYWQGINVPDSLIQDAARTLLNQIFVSPSTPYRPFGTYMLCSSNGAACIQNTQTVLEMLSLTMPSQQTSFDEIVQACLSEHIRYDSVLEEVLQNSIRGIRSIENSNSESPYEMGILLQLEAIGVGAQNDHAQLALRKAGETEERYNTNVDKLAIELSLKQSSMAELEWYKESCEDGYYDNFKNQDRKGIHADINRVKLAGFWDEIIEKWEGHELPSDFESQNKWINAGNTYRKLVEPLDIAYYYRNNRNGNYLSDGRPKRHKVLQEWMEAKEKTRSSRGSSRGQRSRGKPASLTEDSCFWAYVEEAWKALENLKQGQHQSLQSLEEFERYVTTMNDALKISADVLFEGSRFMTWKAEWEKYKREHSP
eukprot:PITA_32539